jgi:hypothetical protein
MRIPYTVGFAFFDGPDFVSLEPQVDVVLDVQGEVGPLGEGSISVLDVFMRGRISRPLGTTLVVDQASGLVSILRARGHLIPEVLQRLARHAIVEAMADKAFVERVLDTDPNIEKTDSSILLGGAPRWRRRPE